MADNKVTIEISLEGNAQVQFKKLGDAAEDFAASTKKSFGDAGRIFDNFVANLASNAVSGAFDILKEGFSALNGLLHDAVKAAADQEVAVNALNQALAQSGHFSKQASQSLQDFAAGLQSTTKYSDDAVLSASALIEQLGRLDQEGLKKATKASLDLASALRIDLQSAANLVGKAADGNVSVLSRYGITVKETGDKAHDFALALEQIQKKFGGSAASEVNTYAGAVAQLKNEYDDVLKVVGQSIITNPVLLELIQRLGDEFSDLSEYVSENRATLNTLISVTIVDALKIFGYFIQVTDYLVRTFGALQGAIAAVIGAFGALNPVLLLFSKFSDTANYARQAFVGLAEDGIKKLKDSLGGDSLLSDTKSKIDDITASVEAMTEASNTGALAQLENQSAQNQLEEELLITQQGRQIIAAQNQINTQNESLTKYADYLLKRNDLLKTFDDQASKDQIARNNATIQQILATKKLSNQQELELQAKTNTAKKEQDAILKATLMDSIGAIASLSTAKTKELAVIGKAAAIAQATISTILGATRAYADLPFPASVVVSALVAAAGAVNIARIAGVELATGMTEVPPGFQNDTFPARLSSGERVVSAPQNKDLTDFLTGSTGLTAKLDQLIFVLSSGSARPVVNIGGREIIGAIQDELDSGRSLNV